MSNGMIVYSGTPDWNESNQNSANYIQNRPFYENIAEGDTLLDDDYYFNSQMTSGSSSYYVTTNISNLTTDQTLKVTFNGSDYFVKPVIFSYGSAGQDYRNNYLGNAAALSNYYGNIGEDTGEPFCLVKTYNDQYYKLVYKGTYGVYETFKVIIKIFINEIKKIDSKFLPDDIGGGDTLPTGSIILIDQDAEVPNGWEVVDEKYDASKVYLSDGRTVQDAIDNCVTEERLQEAIINVLNTPV